MNIPNTVLIVCHTVLAENLVHSDQNVFSYVSHCVIDDFIDHYRYAIRRKTIPCMLYAKVVWEIAMGIMTLKKKKAIVSVTGLFKRQACYAVPVLSRSSKRAGISRVLGDRKKQHYHVIDG